MQVVEAHTDAGLFVLADPVQYKLAQSRLYEVEAAEDLTEGQAFFIDAGGDGSLLVGLLVDESPPPGLEPSRSDQVGRGFLVVSSGVIGCAGGEFGDPPTAESQVPCAPGRYEVEAWCLATESPPSRLSLPEVAATAMAVVSVVLAFCLLVSFVAWRQGGDGEWVAGAGVAFVLSAYVASRLFSRLPEEHKVLRPDCLIRLRPTSKWPDEIRDNMFSFLPRVR